MILAGIGGIVCLLLPSITYNRIRLEEAAPGLIPAVLFGFIVTISAAAMIIKAGKARLR